MGKIDCFICKKEISDKAKKCPYCNSEQSIARKWHKVIEELKNLLSTEEEIQEAKENVEQFIENELDGWEILETTCPTILAFTDHDFYFYDEYTMSKDDYECWEEESKEIIDELSKTDGLSHIICYKYDIDDGFELYYSDINLDKILKATIDEYGTVDFELLNYKDIYIFSDEFSKVITYIGEQQLSKFVNVVSESLFTCNFADPDYIRSYVSSYWTDKFGDYTARTLDKKQIKKMFDIDVKFNYDLCFFENGEMLVMTQLTSKHNINDKKFVENLKQLHEQYPFHNFFTASYPENFHEGDEFCIKAIITDNGANLINFKEFFQEIGQDGLCQDISKYEGVFYLLNLNLPEYIRVVESQCNMMMGNKR